MMFWKDGQPTTNAQAALVVAMKLTMASRAEPEHFLIAMSDDETSALSKACFRVRPGLRLATLRDTIVASSRKRSGQALAQTGWTAALIADRTSAVLAELASDITWQEASPQEQQRLLAAAMVDAAIPRVKRVFDNMGVGPPDITASLRRSNAEKPPKPEAFDENGRIDRAAFGPSGRAILNLLESEGKGLGLNRVGTPLLLFAHVAREDGLLERALRLQLVDPKQTHENLLVHLRSLGSRRFNEEFALAQDQMQPSVVRAFEKAAEFAFDLDLPGIGDAELLKGLLAQNDLFVSSFFDMLKVNTKELTAYVMQRHSGEEDEVDDQGALPSLTEIEARLLHALDATRGAGKAPIHHF
ncbi:MAG: Clp protease N-terminal domain-containing protein, partial [Pirellulaceae bacterium]